MQRYVRKALSVVFHVLLHVNIIMLHVDINKWHVNIIISHVDIIYLACRGQKYAIIDFLLI